MGRLRVIRVSVGLILLVGAAVLPIASALPAQARGFKPLTPTPTVVPAYTYDETWLPSVAGTQAYAQGVAFVDLTGDGRKDVVMSVGGAFDGTSGQEVWVVPGEDGGGLGAPVRYRIDLPGESSWKGHLDVADMNGDGRKDVVVTGDTTIAILHQTVGGTLGAPERITVEKPGWVAAVDWNGDAKRDLVVGLGDYFGSTTQGIHVLEQGTGGSWTDVQLTADATGQFVVQDFTGDSKPDVVATGDSGTRLMTHDAVGDGVTSSTLDPTYSRTITLGDLNGDGNQDLVLGADNAFLPGNGDGTFGTSVGLPPLGPPVGMDTVATGDLNGDGRDDVIGPNVYGRFYIWLQQTGGSFIAPCFSEASSPNSLAQAIVVDVDGDGRMDVLQPSGGAGPLEIVKGVPLGATRIDLTEVPPGPQPWGSWFDVGGFLTPVGSCPGSDGVNQVVELLRSHDGGPEEVVATQTTDTNARFLFSIQRTPGLGDYDYSVRWDGDVLHGVATSDPVTVTITQGPGLVTVTLRPSQEGVYGSDAHYDIRLRPHDATTNQEIRVYAQPTGRAETLIKDATVDPDTGLLTGRYTDLQRETTFRAEWDGDAEWAPDSGSATLEVATDVRGRLLRASGHDGRYTLYAEGHNVYYVAWTNPSERGETVTITVQKARAGRWRNWASQQFTLGRHSAVGIYIPGFALRRSQGYRMSTTFSRGDPGRYLNGGFSGWQYFRVR